MKQVVLDGYGAPEDVARCIEAPDVGAPGNSILAAYQPDPDSFAMIGGTSMASPHVAGVGALFLGANPGTAPADVIKGLQGQASAGVVQGAPQGTLADLLQIDDVADAGEIPTRPVRGLGADHARTSSRVDPIRRARTRRGRRRP